MSYPPARVQEPVLKCSTPPDLVPPHTGHKQVRDDLWATLVLTSLALRHPTARQMATDRGARLRTWADRLAVDREPGLSTSQLMLTNHDLKPVEPARRQWKAWNFVGFWIADSFNINTWMISSSMVSAGLSWWQSWLCVWIGYAVAACFICATGRIGATYHVGFPVVNRASFGIWGSLWPIFNRAAMACIWYGVQSYIGGECVYLMIRAIWKSWVSSSRSILPRPRPAGR